MSKIFEILGLLSWIICFCYETVFNLKSYSSKDYFKDFKKEALQIVRLDRLFLITIFIIYIRFNKDFITSLVFAVICLYLYINKLYEKSKKISIKNVIQKYWLTILLVIISTILPFVYFGVTKNMDLTCVILLFYIFFNYFLVGISKNITKFLLKKNRKK